MSWSRIILALLLALVLVSGCAVDGIHMARPATTISAGPSGFTFANSKDVLIDVEEAGYDPESKQMHIKNLKVSDNASAVRIANVEQMDAAARQAEANWLGASQMMQAMTGVLQQLIPIIGQLRSQAAQPVTPAIDIAALAKQLTPVIQQAVESYLDSKSPQPADPDVTEAQELDAAWAERRKQEGTE